MSKRRRVSGKSSVRSARFALSFYHDGLLSIFVVVKSWSAVVSVVFAVAKARFVGSAGTGFVGAAARPVIA